MPKIFISYRRDDSADISARICSALQSHFGRKNVFLDIEAIGIGQDFRRSVSEAIRNSDVVVVVIGTRWIGHRDGDTNRIDAPDDPVRNEIEAAFEQGKPMIPVLVGGAAMPDSESLPASIASLTDINATSIRSDQCFERDVCSLITEIKRILGVQGTLLSGILLALLATLLLSAVNVAIKHLVSSDLHALSTALGLYLFASLSLYLLATVSSLLGSKEVKPVWPPFPVWISKACETLCFVYALSYISAGQATILSKLNTLWAFAFLWVMARNEVGRLSLLGAVVSFVGVYVVVGGSNTETIASDRAIGSALAVAAGFFFAAFSVILAKHERSMTQYGVTNRLRFTSRIFALAAIPIAPFALMYGGMPTYAQLGVVAITGVIGIGGGYLLYYLCLTRLSSLVAVAMFSLTVPLTLAIEYLALGAPFKADSIIGGILIVCGVFAIAKEVEGLKAAVSEHHDGASRHRPRL